MEAVVFVYPEVVRRPLRALSLEKPKRPCYPVWVPMRSARGAFPHESNLQFMNTLTTQPRRYKTCFFEAGSRAYLSSRTDERKPPNLLVIPPRRDAIEEQGNERER